MRALMLLWMPCGPIWRLGSEEVSGLKLPPQPYACGMDFTPLHRALGLQPCKLTNDILDQAIKESVAETDDLDWKQKFPPMKALTKSDVPKDIAAMANRGGGMIIYGVEEKQRNASSRVHVEPFDENEERTYRSVAVTAITPPVFDLDIRRIGTDPMAVAIIVPASIDGPHLIYKDDFFGAPIRNNADTAWMKERQIELMYKARFDERRRSNEAVESLYTETTAGRDIEKRAWMVAVARPRTPRVPDRITRADAREVFEKANRFDFSFGDKRFVHPLQNVDLSNPRPGLRRWSAPTVSGDRGDAWAGVHYDGSVTLAAALGASPSGQGSFWKGNEVEAFFVERGVADFMALVRAAGDRLGCDEYEVRIGIELAMDEPLTFIPSGHYIDLRNQAEAVAVPVYIPVQASVNTVVPGDDYLQQVFTIAQDCVNQGGISHLVTLQEPEPAND